MLSRRSTGILTLWFTDQRITAREGDSIASALLAAGVLTTRHTAISGAQRGPFCMMGACFECLAVVDGRQNVQTCMTPARDGMRVMPQHGPHDLA